MGVAGMQATAQYANRNERMSHKRINGYGLVNDFERHH
jgi:hypothetical protein